VEGLILHLSWYNSLELVSPISGRSYVVGTRAFILIETQVGRARQVAETLRSFQGVRSADVITGQFDVIALVEVQDLREMADLITARVQGIRGVVRTITCVAAG
jgi:DNA-binding Lrp family transcriptional regulator